MLPRPPPPQCRSFFFLASAWLLTRSNQRSKSLHTQRHGRGTRCDQSTTYLRRNIDTHNIQKRYETNHQPHIMIYVVIALHLELVKDMRTHNEHTAFLFVSDVKLSVTEVLIPINSVERVDGKMGIVHLSSFLTVTSPPSCNCMVVETKGSC